LSYESYCDFIVFLQIYHINEWKYQVQRKSLDRKPCLTCIINNKILFLMIIILWNAAKVLVNWRNSAVINSINLLYINIYTVHLYLASNVICFLMQSIFLLYLYCVYMCISFYCFIFSWRYLCQNILKHMNIYVSIVFYYSDLNTWLKLCYCIKLMCYVFTQMM